MAILEKEVLVGIGGSSASHYEKLGYLIPKYKDEYNRLRIKQGTKILVKTEDVPTNSKIKVTKICDIEGCGKYTYNQPIYAIMASRKKGEGKDRCFECGKLLGANNKRNNTSLEKTLEYWAKENNKEYLLSEFSKSNKRNPMQISYACNDDFWWDCSKCGGNYVAELSNRTILNRNCPYCAGRKVLIGFNDLWTTQPKVAKLLSNAKEGYEVTSGSQKKLEFVCDKCKISQIKKVNNVVYKGFSCSKCSDGIPYPEKFMISVLNQLNINFESQKIFHWSKGIKHKNSLLNGTKLYDFYIPDLNCIIETHGEQHYSVSFERVGGKTLAEEQDNDRLKKDLAKDNNINKYIVIDCSISDLEFIKNNILSSDLSAMFNFKNINWEECHEFACGSLVKTVCDLWFNGINNTLEISKTLKLNRSTVTDYLKKGSILGWCEYNPKEEVSKSSYNIGKKNNKIIVQLTKDNEYVKTWNSATEAGKTLGINGSNISNTCIGNQRSTGGYKWMFIEDYNHNKDNLIPYEVKKWSLCVVKLDLEGKFIEEYPSLTKAAELNKIGIKMISKVCKGYRNKTGGFKWMYKEDYDKLFATV